MLGIEVGGVMHGEFWSISSYVSLKMVGADEAGNSHGSAGKI
jgi:hypothetical protein